MSGDPNRDAIVAYALTVEGPITTTVYDAVKQAIADGVLAARLPDKVTLYRWLRGVHPSNHSRGVTRATEAGRAKDVVQPNEPSGSGASTPALTSFQALQPRIKLAEIRLHTLGALLLQNGLFEPHRNDHKILIKRLGRSRSGVLSMPVLTFVLDKADAKIAAYVTLLTDAGIELPEGIAAETTPQQSAPGGDADTPAESCVALVPASVPPVPTTDPMSMPVYTGPIGENLPAGNQWGALAAQVPAASYGMVVGHVETTKTEKDARIRARLLAPVLTGKCSLAACAAVWRRAFRGEAGDEGKLLVHGIDIEYRIEYRNITERTLRRWRDRVLAEQELAREAGDETALSVATILEHRQTDLRTPRKATPELTDRAVKIFTEQQNWSKARVARHLREKFNVEVSDRLVQSILASELSDKERALARGGVAADEYMFRRRLFREAKYPNRTWIMDHSFLRHEITLPEYETQIGDYDFEFEFVTYRSGVKKRVKGLWLSLVMDACTRRVLAIRLWDKAPTSRDTLLCLRDAMERFGVPEILYTDNGSDLNSGLVRQALDAAGIHHVNSRPYTPQGRGKIERLFRTIKEKVLDGIEGYYGGRHGATWGEADLLTLDEVQERIWAGIESLMNNVRHSETKRVPTKHYEDEVGARRLRHVGPAIASPEAMLVLLLVDYDVLNRTSGFNFAGRRYYSVHLGDVPNGARLIVHYDPANLDVVHVSVPGPQAAIVYLGVAEYYNKDHEPPTFIEQQVAEAEWARANEQHLAQRRIEREQVARLEAQRVAGELLGVATAEDVAKESGLALSASRTKMLPVFKPAPDADVTPHDAYADTEATVADDWIPAQPDDADGSVDAIDSKPDSTPTGTVPVISRRSKNKKDAVVVTMPWD